jgi:hypothetical protein
VSAALSVAVSKGDREEILRHVLNTTLGQRAVAWVSFHLLGFAEVGGGGAGSGHSLKPVLLCLLTDWG